VPCRTPKACLTNNGKVGDIKKLERLEVRRESIKVTNKPQNE